MLDAQSKREPKGESSDDAGKRNTPFFSNPCPNRRNHSAHGGAGGIAIYDHDAARGCHFLSARENGAMVAGVVVPCRVYRLRSGSIFLLSQNGPGAGAAAIGVSGAASRAEADYRVRGAAAYGHLHAAGLRSPAGVVASVAGRGTDLAGAALAGDSARVRVRHGVGAMDQPLCRAHHPRGGWPEGHHHRAIPGGAASPLLVQPGDASFHTAGSWIVCDSACAFVFCADLCVSNSERGKGSARRTARLHRLLRANTLAVVAGAVVRGDGQGARHFAGLAAFNLRPEPPRSSPASA